MINTQAGENQEQQDRRHRREHKLLLKVEAVPTDLRDDMHRISATAVSASAPWVSIADIIANCMSRSNAAFGPLGVLARKTRC